MSTACSKSAASKLPSARRNFIRLIEARLQAELSTCMYSLHGLEALIRPDSGQVCQRLIVVSKPASRRAPAFSSSLALHQMKSSMSGWSTSRTTIFAARRVLPPDLIVPAQASAPRMKLTGPEARPPFESGSTELRMLERLIPEPEPPRKMTPSRRIQSRIESIESSIERMKQAEHCGFSSKPTLNQTGLLKAAYWLTRIALSSDSKVSASSSVAK